MVEAIRKWGYRIAESWPMVFRTGRWLNRVRMALLRGFWRVADILLTPFTLIVAAYSRFVRWVGFEHLPATKGLFFRAGVYPLLDHYYEPRFDFRKLERSLREDRALPGVDMNVGGQLALLESFHYQEELERFPMERRARLEFSYNDGAFLSGDSEYLYCMIRHFRPSRILEIGAGHSTLMMRNAVAANTAENPGYRCDHRCVEPFEAGWLEELGIPVIRERVETMSLDVFRDLGENDILFIDSSHMIRPQGDVLFLYQQVIPSLRPGVLVHVHDIFTPKDYLDQWLKESVYFWNEQYLLEALLVQNARLKVVGAVNYLKHHHGDAISARMPILRQQFSSREPGSFWMAVQG